MSHNTPSELDWIVPILHKHTADAVSIMGDLIGAGLRDGVCSVNDIQCRPEDPRVISACMKVLKCMGFRHTDEKIPDLRIRAKRGKVSLWRLEERNKAEAYLEYQLQYFTCLLEKPL